MSQTDRIPPSYVTRETVVERPESSNTAAIILTIVLAVLVVGAVLWFANRGAENSVAPASTTTIITPAPAPAIPAPSTEVTPPAPTNMAPATDTAPASNDTAPAPTTTAPAPAPAP